MLCCYQLKAHPEIYEGCVPMAYDDYLKKISRYYLNSCLLLLVSIINYFVKDGFHI